MTNTTQANNQFANGYMGYGNNGCACSACGNANGGGAYSGYPYNSTGCCGRGFAAGPGLFDSRCFIPISSDDIECDD